VHNERLKEKVHDYWNKASCGTDATKRSKHSREYFEEIEAHRYDIEAQIFSFAQFTRFKDKKILEVGVGAGTDFLQWVRAGAHAHGIDLTQEAIDNVKARLALYGLQARDLRVADAERLPYPDSYFDCVYSWGVIHHSPNTKQCLAEIVRVTKPGGIAKVMIYNRCSLFAYYRYWHTAFLKGKPFQKVSTVLWNHQESHGTKAYTLKEVKKMVSKHPVVIKQLKATFEKNDYLSLTPRPYQWLGYVAACLFGWNKVGWFLTVELQKKEGLRDEQ